MRKDIVIGGYIINAAGARHQLPVALNPSNSTTEDIIKKISNSGKGVVVMRREPPSQIGPHKLELYVDSGNFLLMLGVNEEDGDYSVRTPTNSTMPNDLMIVLGEKYPAKSVTRDIGFVCAVFNEFSNDGNVSTDLLS
jgi:hypothetical protein